MNCQAFTEKDNFMSLVYKIKSKNYKKIFFLVFLFIFSILFNQHYANLGIYPIDSPGGWQIIGKTFLNLFDINKERPSYISPGNIIRFRED